MGAGPVVPVASADGGGVTALDGAELEEGVVLEDVAVLEPVVDVGAVVDDESPHPATTATATSTTTRYLKVELPRPLSDTRPTVSQGPRGPVSRTAGRRQFSRRVPSGSPPPATTSIARSCNAVSATCWLNGP